MSSITVISPTTQQPVVEIPCLSKQEIDKVVQNAVNAFKPWKKVPVADKVAIIDQFLKIFPTKQEEISKSIASQMGRPAKYGVGEVKGVLERASYMNQVAIESLQDEHFTDREGFTRFLRKEPLGPILIIAAWNYPYLTMVNNVIPALLAGNTVLLKQSPQTPLCADIFAQSLHEAGIPKHVLQVTHIDDEGANYLVQHPQIKFVNFTGSVEIGKKIRQSISESGKLIGSAMELGGKDPAYVCDDSDVDYAVENIVDGAFFNSGQCCCAIERCYVQDSVYDEFVEKAVALTKKYVLGNPEDPESTVGPMASVRFADKVRAHIHDAVDKGAKALIDTGKVFPADKAGTAFVAPQILVNVNHSMAVMQDETFGPVLAIMKVSSDQEAVQLMNDSRYGLTASIWTRNAQRALDIGDEIETGTWFMNRCDYIDPGLCWVGAKESGLGFSMSHHGFDQFVRPKSFHLKLTQN
ncbi:aldehyde dehydrogenase [Umbelopsis sp. PMI_123]|nr:aldehyde dehydrogenase [Umbelopsis sp. PMI_123]